jgi:hypothetical protein
MECPEGMEKHIGRRMKEEPELIGGETCARGAVREQVVLVLLDHKLHRSPSGVARLINEPAVPVFQVGNDKAEVWSDRVVFDLGDDSSGSFPGLRLMEDLCIPFHRLLVLPGDPRDLFGKRLDLSDQGSEGPETEDIPDVVLFTKIKNSGTGVMGIPPEKDAHLRPDLPDLANHPLEDRNDLGTIRPASGAKDRGNQFAAFALIEMNGHIAVAAVIGVEKRQLLAAVSQIIGVIDIQDNTLRRFLVGVDKHSNKHLRDTIKICFGKRVLKTADGRLTGQGRIFLRKSFTGYFHHRIVPQFIAVVAVLIAAGNLEDPLLEQFAKLMFDITGMATVMQRVDHFANKSHPVLHLAEEKKPRVGTDLPAGKIRFNFFMGNVFEKEQLFGTIFHGCFLFFFMQTYYISIRYEGKQLFL